MDKKAKYISLIWRADPLNSTYLFHLTEIVFRREYLFQDNEKENNHQLEKEEI